MNMIKLYENIIMIAGTVVAYIINENKNGFEKW